MAKRTAKAHGVLECVYCFKPLKNPGAGCGRTFAHREYEHLASGRAFNIICPACKGENRIIAAPFVVVEGFDLEGQEWQPYWSDDKGRHIEYVKRTRSLTFVQKKEIERLYREWYPREEIARLIGEGKHRVSDYLAKRYGKRKCYQCKQKVGSRKRRRRAY